MNEKQEEENTKEVKQPILPFSTNKEVKIE